MLRFPFDQRQAPPVEKQKDEKALVKMNENNNEALATDGLSPELSYLLSMAMKDGMKDSNMQKMFEEIMPFVPENEKKALNRMFGANTASEYDDGSRKSQGRGTSLSGYSKQSNQQDMLNMLETYSQGQGGEMMEQFKRSMQMQKEFEDMQKKFEKLGDMNNAKPEDMIEMMSMFMPGDEMSELKNMQNMMKLFGNMGNMNNMKPEDMMRFMNLNKK